jgi:hypothetical protein
MIQCYYLSPFSTVLHKSTLLTIKFTSAVPCGAVRYRTLPYGAVRQRTAPYGAVRYCLSGTVRCRPLSERCLSLTGAADAVTSDNFHTACDGANQPSTASFNTLLQVVIFGSV